MTPAAAACKFSTTLSQLVFLAAGRQQPNEPVKSQIRSDQIRSDQIRPNQIRPDLDHIRLDQIRPNLDQLRSDQIDHTAVYYRFIYMATISYLIDCLELLWLVVLILNVE